MVDSNGARHTLLGVLALMGAAATTMISVLIIGGLFLLSAFFQAVFAMTAGRWAGFGLHLLLAFLYGSAGIYLVWNPTLGAATLTMIFTFFFIISGLFRIVGSAIIRYSGWGWAFLSGVVTMGLGVYLGLNLIAASLFFLGTMLAVDLIFVGATLASFGVALRRSASARASRLAHVYT